MAKKKDKPQVINNIQELNLKIDYDKLAEAIVKVKQIEEEKAREKKIKTTKTSFWHKVWCVITNKTDDATVSLTSALTGLMSLFFNAVSWLLLIFGLLCIAVSVVVIIQKTALQYLATYIVMAVLLTLLALIMRGIANEIGREEDKNYIIAAFSSVVSFVALIVALIALFKGVG